MDGTADKKYYLFFNRVLNSTVIYADGMQAQFVGGQYATDSEERAAELLSAIKSGNPHLYIDPNKYEVTAEQLDPMAEYKQRVIAEYLAKQTAQVADSTSAQSALKPAGSDVLSAGAVDSDSGSAAQQAASSASSASSGIKVTMPNMASLISTSK